MLTILVVITHSIKGHILLPQVGKQSYELFELGALGKGYLLHRLVNLCLYRERLRCLEDGDELNLVFFDRKYGVDAPAEAEPSLSLVVLLVEEKVDLDLHRFQACHSLVKHGVITVPNRLSLALFLGRLTIEQAGQGSGFLGLDDGSATY